MTTQAEKAQALKALMIPGDPLILYNIWDAGTAKAAAKAGAKAIATGSWSVAAAQGYPDGHEIPLDLLLTITTRIAATCELPLSVDFEGGYATAPADLATNVTSLMRAGAVGINFEDQIVGGEGLHETAAQAKRIEALRAAAEAEHLLLVINARTDLFLKSKDHGSQIAEAKTRAKAYAEAGATSFFIPGLTDLALITEITEASPLPVNVMAKPGLPPLADLKKAKVARISHGPGPYATAMAAFTEATEHALKGT
ncbi:MAG: isocitrate lyase/phosphoenolpyruvate mutase family protein [Pseudomonadota bacterium]